MKVRIGINPITWSNDDAPELGGDIPLEVCLSETKQAGYAGTELGGKFPRQSAELKPIMQRHGLAVISGWYDGRCDEKDVGAEMDAIGPHLQLLKDMGSTHVVYADTSRGRHGAIWDPISKRPSAAGRGMADLWAQAYAACRTHGGFRGAHGLPPPYGNHYRNGRRSWPADEAYGRGRWASL